MIFYLIGIIFGYALVGVACGCIVIDASRWVRVLTFFFWPVALPILALDTIFVGLRMIFYKD